MPSVSFVGFFVSDGGCRSVHLDERLERDGHFVAVGDGVPLDGGGSQTSEADVVERLDARRRHFGQHRHWPVAVAVGSVDVRPLRRRPSKGFGSIFTGGASAATKPTTRPTKKEPATVYLFQEAVHQIGAVVVGAARHVQRRVALEVDGVDGGAAVHQQPRHRHGREERALSHQGTEEIRSSCTKLGERKVHVQRCIYHLSFVGSQELLALLLVVGVLVEFDGRPICGSRFIGLTATVRVLCSPTSNASHSSVAWSFGELVFPLGLAKAHCVRVFVRDILSLRRSHWVSKTTARSDRPAKLDPVSWCARRGLTRMDHLDRVWMVHTVHTGQRLGVSFRGGSDQGRFPFPT